MRGVRHYARQDQAKKWGETPRHWLLLHMPRGFDVDWPRSMVP